MRSLLAPILVVSLVGLAVRLLAAGALPLLSDEAYYLLWSRSPALGYFDQPPLIAWLLVGVPLPDPAPLLVRLPALGCGLLGGLATAAVARSAPLAVAWWVGVPALFGLTVFATPDAPLLAAWAGVIAAAAVGGRAWLVAGALAGVAVLAKHPAVLALPIALIALGPSEWRRPWPWLGAGLAALLVVPHLAWLAGNDLVTVRFQLGEGFVARAPGWVGPLRVVGDQALVLGPVVAVAGAGALFERARGGPSRGSPTPPLVGDPVARSPKVGAQPARQLRVGPAALPSTGDAQPAQDLRDDPSAPTAGVAAPHAQDRPADPAARAARIGAWTAGVILALFLVASPFGEPEAHWPAPAWVGLGFVVASARAAWIRRTAWVGLAIGLLGALVLTGIAAGPIEGLAPSLRARFTEAPALARIAEALPPGPILAERYHEAALIAVLTGRPATRPAGCARDDQFDRWRAARDGGWAASPSGSLVASRPELWRAARDGGWAASLASAPPTLVAPDDAPVGWAIRPRSAESRWCTDVGWPRRGPTIALDRWQIARVRR